MVKLVVSASKKDFSLEELHLYNKKNILVVTDWTPNHKKFKNSDLWQKSEIVVNPVTENKMLFVSFSKLP